MATEDRLVHVETSVRNHDAMFNLLCTLLERHEAMFERQEAMLEEIRRDSKQTQRLWVRLAQRYGWIEDEDFTAD